MATRVLVLAGGNSPEREVSIRSGQSVVKALRAGGYEVVEADPADGVDKWLPVAKSCSITFPVLHGIGGEDGQMQQVLEDSGIVFVGSGSKASRLCFNKAEYDRFLSGKDILVPRTELVDYAGFKSSVLSSQPFVLKPNDGGSSIDNLIVRELSSLDPAQVSKLFDLYPKLLLQELIVGREITVAVVGDKSLPVIEIIPPSNQEFDFANKYNGATQELCPPEHINESEQSEAQQLAKQVHDLCGCVDMSRTDIMVTDDSKLYVLETNTIPGLTEQSLLPKAAAAAGIDMPSLCKSLVEGAMQRQRTGVS
jgi:D-alanine-D-alanine ligase